MSLTRKIAGGLAVGAGAAALLVAAALLFRAKGVATDLYSLAGAGGGLLGDLAGKTAAEIRVLCADEARAEACRAVFPFRPAPDPSALLDYFKAHGRGLLADRSRELLEAGDFDRIRRSVMRRDYTGVGLFAKADDPYYFLSDYVAGLKSLMPKGLAEGQVLLTGTVGKGADLAPLIALAETDDGIWLSGAPFHAFLATEKSKREINSLGGISLAVILVLGLVLFRSPRFIVPTLATLSFGFLVGATTVFALFPKPHILTFLFGSTLIGLGVDYCYHSLAAKESGASALRRNLTAALATTALSFAPLLFSSVAVLNQMAAFTISGLVAIWALAVTNDRSIPARSLHLPRPNRRRWRFAFVVASLALLAASLRGVGLLESTNDPSRFYSLPPLLARGEAAVAALLGGGAQRFAVATGGTLEEALQAEEAHGVKGLSRLVPSLRRQRENAALVAAFAGAEPQGDFVTLDTLPAPLRALADAMILTDGDRVRLVSPLDEGADVSCGETVAVVEPRAELERMFARLTDEALRLAGGSFAVMALAFLVLFRRRVLAYALPLAAAVAVTAGTLGWMGETLTLFHLLSFFVLTGLGVDYVIFHSESREGADKDRDLPTRTVVFFSFLTSLVGFGALGLTSFPPMRALGLTLALGLFYAYFFSQWGATGGTRPYRRAIGGNRPYRRAIEAIAPTDIKPLKPSAWYEQKEKGATRLGLLTLWHIYRLFGKTAAKVAALVPVVCVAPFCRGVGWRRLLNFAWSRLDIVDAATRRRDIPRFTFTGDADWRQGGAFLISSHLGAIEVLAALCDPSRPTVHAFRQMTHDPVFTRFLTARLNGFELHAVEDIGVETAVEMQEAVGHGDLVLMAGDRLPASRAAVKGGGRRVKGEARRLFLGEERAWPKGVFRFAWLMECPVYAVAAVRTSWNAYEVKAKRLNAADLLDDYVAFLESEVRARPDQWYQFAP